MKGRLVQFLGLVIATQVAFLYYIGFTKAPSSTIGTSSAVAVPSQPKVAPSSPFHTQQNENHHRVPENGQEMANWMQEEAASTKSNRRVFLAHVGKTGGETIRSALRVGCAFLGNRRAKRACYEKLFDAFYGSHVGIPGEPILSQLTKGFHHYLDLKPRGENLRATHFLFAIRHPLQRFESWFRYVAPANCATVPDKDVAASCRVAAEIRKDPTSFQARFFACFPTMQMVPTVLKQWQAKDAALLSNSTASSCAQMLADTMQGRTGTHMAGHMIANLQYYHHFTLGNPLGDTLPEYQEHLPRELTRRTEQNRGTGHTRNAPVLVIRTPHLWEDMARADRVLGGAGYFSQAGLKVSHQSESFGEMAVVPRDHTLPVCCVLNDELAVYKELVERAVNLDRDTRQATMSHALELCQVDSWHALIHACGLQDEPDRLLHRPVFVPATLS